MQICLQVSRYYQVHKYMYLFTILKAILNFSIQLSLNPRFQLPLFLFFFFLLKRLITIIQKTNKSVFTQMLKCFEKYYICNLGQHVNAKLNEAELVIPQYSTDHCLPFSLYKYHSSCERSWAVSSPRHQSGQVKGLVTDCSG